jgi:hypothetical protein
MASKALFGEKATTKLAGLFDDQERLESVSAQLRTVSGLQNTQLLVVRPHDSDFDKMLEPETQGVVRTAIRSHVVLGLAGLAMGAILWGLLYLFGVEAVTSSPFYSGGTILVFSLVGGMLLGGLVTARPDHQAVIRAVDEATKAGRWSLVIHPRDEQQCQSAQKVLEGAGVETVRSLL